MYTAVYGGAVNRTSIIQTAVWWCPHVLQQFCRVADNSSKQQKQCSRFSSCKTQHINFYLSYIRRICVLFACSTDRLSSTAVAIHTHTVHNKILVLQATVSLHVCHMYVYRLARLLLLLQAAPRISCWKLWVYIYIIPYMSSTRGEGREANRWAPHCTSR